MAEAVLGRWWYIPLFLIRSIPHHVFRLCCADPISLLLKAGSAQTAVSGRVIVKLTVTGIQPVSRA